MKKLLIIVLALLAGVALADEESVDAMKARVQTTSPKDQVELCTRIAERQLDALDKSYGHDDVKQAHADLGDVVRYGTQAAERSTETGKRMKHTEIALRKISTRLEAIRKTLDLDERPPLLEAIQKLEAARTDLLNRMFRK